MLKLMKYLKKSVGSIVLIIGLLFLQAYCDLSLPDYTSKIINVGIQQKGIEDGVPEKIRESSLENLQLFMSQEDKTEISNAYIYRHIATFLCRITHQRLLMWEFSRRGLRMEYRKISENLLLKICNCL